ncbi:hypothetical protein B0H10DRAFT_1940371 [Mycena sp. CBHHK59/15]|nr:hypothetical protein B0H10DRAFT_1940371 [Mycena sp. CBHHK59/15]
MFCNHWYFGSQLHNLFSSTDIQFENTNQDGASCVAVTTSIEYTIGVAKGVLIQVDPWPVNIVHLASPSPHHRHSDVAPLAAWIQMESEQLSSVNFVIAVMDEKIRVIVFLHVHVRALPDLTIQSSHQLPSTPFEVCQTMERVENQASQQLFAVSSKISRMDLSQYIESRYKSEFTKVEVEEATYHGGPIRVVISTDLWCCTVFKSESNPFQQAKQCGHQINLWSISKGIAVHPSVALVETEFHETFNKIILDHLHNHMRGFSLDFDPQGLGLSRNDCQAVIIYIPPLLH